MITSPPPLPLSSLLPQAAREIARSFADGQPVRTIAGKIVSDLRWAAGLALMGPPTPLRPSTGDWPSWTAVLVGLSLGLPGEPGPLSGTLTPEPPDCCPDETQGCSECAGPSPRRRRRKHRSEDARATGFGLIRGGGCHPLGEPSPTRPPFDDAPFPDDANALAAEVERRVREHMAHRAFDCVEDRKEGWVKEIVEAALKHLRQYGVPPTVAWVGEVRATITGATDLVKHLGSLEDDKDWVRLFGRLDDDPDERPNGPMYPGLGIFDRGSDG